MRARQAGCCCCCAAVLRLRGVLCADPLPAILNLKIAGEAVLGGKLTACGHSVYGSSLCYFQVSARRGPAQAAPAAAPR